MPKLSELPARTRVALLVALAAAVLVAAGVLVVAVGGDDDESGGAPESSTTTTTAFPGPDPTTGTGPSSTTATGGGSTTTSATEPGDDRPLPGWASATVSRADAPEGWIEAWERAKNKNTCGLLAPTETLRGLEEANANWDELNNDEGWDVRLREDGRIVEILGLFPKDKIQPRPYPFTRRWRDGSMAEYGPEVPPDQQDEEIDPETTAVEARLTIPDQGCIYQVYDTQGRSHLEYVLDHLAFVAGTR